MQRLKGNSHGFLVGDAVEIGDLVGTWTDMQSDLRAIRKALEGGAGFGGGGGRVNKSANVQAQIPPQNKRPTDSASIATPSVRGAGGGRVLGGKNGAFSGNYSASNAEKPNKNKVLTAQVASTVNAFTAGQKAQRNAQALGKRDNKGRFTWNGGGGGADDLGGGGGGGSIKGVVDKLSRTLDSMGNAEQVDPAVKAFNEVAKPMTRGLQGLGILGDGESREERATNRWRRRFWGFFKKQQNDTEKHQKEVKKSLKVIEEKPVGKGGGGGGGFFSRLFSKLGLLISGGVGGIFAAITGGLARGVASIFTTIAKGLAGGLGSFLKSLQKIPGIKKLPIVGAAITALLGLFDIFDSETSNMTRGEKDKATGKAVGRTAGGVGGMLAGAALGSLAGPIGTLIGGALGAWLGDKAGAIIGEQVGTYARSAFAAIKASAGYLWDEATSIFDGMGDAANKAFASVKEDAKKAFDDFSKFASDVSKWFGGLTERLNKWVKEKTGFDIGARASELNKQRKEMVSNAWEATKSKASEWGGAAYDWAYEQAASSTMGKAAQKGIDAWNESRAETTSWSGRARDDLVGASLAAGADPALVTQIAHLESRFNADARPINKNGELLSSAHGYGQFLDDTWTEVVNRHGSKYGVEGAGKLTKAQAQALRNDPALQAAMLAEFTNENVARGRKLGGANDAANAYAFHNLGAGDATRLLRAMQANPNASVRDALQSNSSQKEKDRVAKVLANNPSLYGKRGDATVSEAYANMGAKLDAGASYGRDAAKHAQVLKNGAGYGAGALASAGQAGGAVQFPTTAAIPTAGMQAVMPSVAPAPAPELPALLSSNADKQRQTPLIPLVDAGQDISERGIAHIATGGISG